MKRSIVHVAILGTLAMLLPGTATARIDDTCSRDEIHGRLVQPDGGSLVITTGPTGPIVLDGAGQQVFVSATGTIEAVAAYGCMMNLTLTVERVDPATGATTPHSVFSWSDAGLNGPDGTPCSRDATVSALVEIGLDAGQFQFTLSGDTCHPEIALRPDTQGGLVADPPLPL